MRVDINLSNNDPFQTSARSVYEEFAKASPEAVLGADLEERVNQLATLLSQAPISHGQNNSAEVVLPSEILPIEMRKWALTREGATPEITAVALKSLSANPVTSPPYTIANQNWSDVQVVVKAHDGVRGAWFYSNVDRGSVLVKGQEGAEEQLMGTAFLRNMGMNAPDSKIVKRSSQEGECLSQLGDQQGLNKFKPSSYIVMERVLGPSYANLSSCDDNIKLVNDNLENLGELAVYDLVLGNFDRFQLEDMSFNAGNIMFENNLLRPIDTDCICLNNDRLPFTKLVLKKIVEGRSDAHIKIARKLESNLGAGVKEGSFSEDLIKKGMEKALDKILTFTQNLETNKQSFVASCNARGREGSDFPKHLEELLLHVRACKMGVTNAK